MGEKIYWKMLTPDCRDLQQCLVFFEEFFFAIQSILSLHKTKNHEKKIFDQFRGTVFHSFFIASSFFVIFLYLRVSGVLEISKFTFRSWKISYVVSLPFEGSCYCEILMISGHSILLDNAGDLFSTNFLFLHVFAGLRLHIYLCIHAERIKTEI